MTDYVDGFSYSEAEKLDFPVLLLCFRCAWQAKTSQRQTGQRRSASSFWVKTLLYGFFLGPVTSNVVVQKGPPSQHLYFEHTIEKYFLKMKRRIHIAFVLACSLLCSSSAFYLPGLAPVSFCEETNGGDDCQVCCIQKAWLSCVLGFCYVNCGLLFKFVVLYVISFNVAS